jgi:hypothetical protein
MKSVFTGLSMPSGGPDYKQLGVPFTVRRKYNDLNKVLDEEGSYLFL